MFCGNESYVEAHERCYFGFVHILEKKHCLVAFKNVFVHLTIISNFVWLKYLMVANFIIVCTRGQRLIGRNEVNKIDCKI